MITFVMRNIYAMKERIIEFLRSENKSSAQLAEDIGVQPSGISHILSGRNKPSLDFIIKMLEKYPYLSTEWLLFGKGVMYKDFQMQSLFDEASLSNAIPEPRPVGSSFPASDAPARPSSGQESSGNISIEQGSGSGIVRIVWFLSDNSFIEYFPKK